MKASVKRALALLDRQSFSGVDDFKQVQRFNREFVNPGSNPHGHGVGDIYFDMNGRFDYWAEDDQGITRHYLFTVEKDGEVTIEELEITEDDL